MVPPHLQAGWLATNEPILRLVRLIAGQNTPQTLCFEPVHILLVSTAEPFVCQLSLPD